MNELRAIVDRLYTDIEQYVRSRVEQEVRETLRRAMAMRQPQSVAKAKKTSSPGVGKKQAPRVKRGSRFDAVIERMDREPTRAFRATDLQDLVPESTVASINTALYRLLQQGRIAQAGRGQFKSKTTEHAQGGNGK